MKRSPEGMIFLPERFYNRFTDLRKSLFRLIAEEFNFPFYARNSFGVIPNNLKLLLLSANPHGKNELMDIENIPDKVKVIWWQCDLHADRVLKNLSKVFKRVDKIIGPYDIAFKQRFPQFLDKFIPFKNFFAPDRRYTSLSYNINPKMKCLLTGATDNSYPIRLHLKNELTKDRELRKVVDVNWHDHWLHRMPKRLGETKPVYGDEYAKRLNSYFCCATCSTINHYVITKYMEIPAAGSLLLVDQILGSDEVGLIPWKHFVPITKDTVSSRIKEVLANPEDYENIRKQGMKFVRANHSIKNRFEQLKKIIREELLSGR